MLNPDQAEQLRKCLIKTLLEFLWRIYQTKDKMQREGTSLAFPQLAAKAKALSFEDFLLALMNECARVDFAKVLEPLVALDLDASILDVSRVLNANDTPWTFPEYFDHFPVLLNANVFGFRQFLQITNSPVVGIARADFLINAVVFGSEVTAFIEAAGESVTFGLADAGPAKGLHGVFQSYETESERLWGHHHCSIMLKLDYVAGETGGISRSSIYSHAHFGGAPNSMEQGPYSKPRECLHESS